MSLLPQIASADVTTEEVAARLASEFGGDLVDVRVDESVTVVARVAPAQLKSVARRLRELPEIGYEMLNFIAAVDKRTHYESVYHLYSFASNKYLELHVDLPRAKPQVDTVSDMWPAADWHEREAFDMMGIVYVGHPDLRRILLRDEFVGYPLRKDYVDTVENHPNA